MHFACGKPVNESLAGHHVTRPSQQSTLIDQLPSRLDAPEKESQAAGERAGRAVARHDTACQHFRHSGWTHNRQLLAESLARTGQSLTRQDGFWDCGSYAYVLESVDRPGTFRVAGSACHDRFCVPCAQERSYTIAGNVLDAIRGKEVRFLTLTIKTDGLTLKESLAKLYKAFAALRRRRWIQRKMWGGVAFLELKWSESGNRWHPHLHCLTTGTYLAKRELSAIWHSITGDSFIVDIQRPKNDDDVARYVSKYASKPFNNTFVGRPELIDEAVVAMKGRKLAMTWGSWRGLQLTATPDDGAWEHVAPLSVVIASARAGDQAMVAILKAIWHGSIDCLLSRAPPPSGTEASLSQTQEQATFIDRWETDGTWKEARQF